MGLRNNNWLDVSREEANERNAGRQGGHGQLEQFTKQGTLMLGGASGLSPINNARSLKRFEILSFAFYCTDASRLTTKLCPS